MTTTVVSNSAPFGQMSNAVIRNIYFVNDYVTRVNGAIAQAESGYSGVTGAEFENSTFGVQQSGATGAKGADWAFAFATLASAWATFMSSASASLAALDNGQT